MNYEILRAAAQSQLRQMKADFFSGASCWRTNFIPSGPNPWPTSHFYSMWTAAQIPFGTIGYQLDEPEMNRSGPTPHTSGSTRHEVGRRLRSIAN